VRLPIGRTGYDARLASEGPYDSGDGIGGTGARAGARRNSAATARETSSPERET